MSDAAISPSICNHGDIPMGLPRRLRPPRNDGKRKNGRGLDPSRLSCVCKVGVVACPSSRMLYPRTFTCTESFYSFVEHGNAVIAGPASIQ